MPVYQKRWCRAFFWFLSSCARAMARPHQRPLPTVFWTASGVASVDRGGLAFRSRAQKIRKERSIRLFLSGRQSISGVRHALFRDRHPPRTVARRLLAKAKQKNSALFLAPKAADPKQGGRPTLRRFLSFITWRRASSFFFARHKKWDRVMLPTRETATTTNPREKRGTTGRTRGNKRAARALKSKWS